MNSITPTTTGLQTTLRLVIQTAVDASSISDAQLKIAPYLGAVGCVIDIHGTAGTGSCFRSAHWEASGNTIYLSVSLNGQGLTGTNLVYLRIATQNPPHSGWTPVASWKVAPISLPVYVPTDNDLRRGLMARWVQMTSHPDYTSEMVNNYTPLGSWFNSENDPYYGHLDSNGIPLYNGVYHPTLIAEYGLHMYGLYLKNRATLASFLNIADELLKLQEADGGLPYPFSINVFGDQVLASGWKSALAQGTALSVWARAYSLTRSSRYKTAGDLALEYLVNSLTTNDATIDPSLDGYITFQEYPTTPASYVLNGDEYTLIGLYDWWQITGSLQAEAYFDAGSESMAVTLPLYDIQTWALYSLRHLTAKVIPLPVPDDYQVHQIALQDVLSHLTGMQAYADYRDKWIQEWTSPSMSLPPLPHSVSVSPTSGSGTAGTFTFHYHDDAGVQQIARVLGFFNTSATMTGGCGFVYIPARNLVELYDGTYTPWTTVGTTGVISVPNCSINAQTMQVTQSATDLTLVVAVSFGQGFRGSQSIYLGALDRTLDLGLNYPFARLGRWTIQ